ncbi:MAG: hypothetical protein QOH56_443, partial [Pseudonocardiales bacterium]|nr:hypothetical protein [Pseudonocardiales bacterium]
AGCPGGIWSIGTAAVDVSAGLVLVLMLLVVLLGTLAVSVAEDWLAFALECVHPTDDSTKVNATGTARTRGLSMPELSQRAPTCEGHLQRLWITVDRVSRPAVGRIYARARGDAGSCGVVAGRDRAISGVSSAAHR